VNVHVLTTQLSALSYCISLFQLTHICIQCKDISLQKSHTLCQRMYRLIPKNLGKIRYNLENLSKSKFKMTREENFVCDNIKKYSGGFRGGCAPPQALVNKGALGGGGKNDVYPNSNQLMLRNSVGYH
jgi:hypothetical protein